MSARPTGSSQSGRSRITPHACVWLWEAARSSSSKDTRWAVSTHSAVPSVHPSTCTCRLSAIEALERLPLVEWAPRPFCWALGAGHAQIVGHHLRSMMGVVLSLPADVTVRRVVEHAKYLVGPRSLNLQVIVVLR